MKLDKIKKLDLRTDEQKAAAKQRAEARALDRMWDWRKPPEVSR